MLLRFWKLDSKVGVWPLYGPLALLMCVGSTTGAVAWVARMLELHYLYVSESDLQRDFSEFLSGECARYVPHWHARDAAQAKPSSTIGKPSSACFIP